ncbi:hypothetical protein AHiyo8_29240 [Arthrobacter sp. Hiyo8]|nr:hypothetical protein AHiyo8_29240 [Arthrobacter sp. Hiyo8]
MDAVLLDLGDGRAKLGIGGVHDQVAHHVAEDFACDRDDHLRQDRSHDAAGAHSSAHVPRKEGRDLRGKLGQVAAGDGQILRADDAVDESHREVQAVRILQDAGEALRGNVNGYLRGFGEPVSNQLDGFVGQLLEVSGFRGGLCPGVDARIPSWCAHALRSFWCGECFVSISMDLQSD